MNTLLHFWFGFLLTSFAVSVLALSAVQTRLIRREGWHVFRTRGPLQLYWRELSPLERSLLWPGITAFFLTLFAAAMGALVHYI